MTPLPGEMMAVVLEEPGTAGLTVVKRPVRAPRPREVVVRVQACGIGRTVVNKVRQLRPEQLPRIPGHEVAGTVAAVGDGVDEVLPGERVLLYYYVTCGRCRYCWEGREPLCDVVAGGSFIRIGEDLDGGLAEYVTVPVRNVIPLPDDLGCLEATTAPDAIATPLHICRRTEIRPGERILVVGAAGGVGIHLLQVARWFGAEPIAVDLPGKLGELERYGASATVDGSAGDWQAPLAASIDVAVDLVGTPETLWRSFATLGRGGRMALLTADPSVDFALAPFRMVGGERTIVGSKYASHAEVAHAAELLADGTIEAVISKSVSLDEAPDVLRAIERGTFFARGALVLQ